MTTQEAIDTLHLHISTTLNSDVACDDAFNALHILRAAVHLESSASAQLPQGKTAKAAEGAEEAASPC